MWFKDRNRNQETPRRARRSCWTSPTCAFSSMRPIRPSFCERSQGSSLRSKVLPVQNGVAKAITIEPSFNLRRELLFLISAFILFCVHYAFEDTFHQRGWTAVEYGVVLAAYGLAGTNIYINAARTIRKGDLFDENVLMVIATTGAIAIHALSEAVSVMLFFKVGELLQNMAVARSRRSIRSLLDAKPDKANVLVGAGIRPAFARTRKRRGYHSGPAWREGAARRRGPIRELKPGHISVNRRIYPRECPARQYHDGGDDQPDRLAARPSHQAL